MLIIVTVAILAITCAVVTVAYSRSLLCQRRLQRENEALRSNIHAKAGALLEEAHRHSLSIIEDANQHAQDMLASTQAYVDHSNEALSGRLKDLTDKQKKQIAERADSLTVMYQNLLENLQKEHINTFRNVSKDIEIDGKEELNAFARAVEEETALSQKELAARVDAAYKKAEQEIAEYKKSELREFDKQVEEAVAKAAEKILGKSLSLSDQEELVVRALEEAHTRLMKSH